MDDVMWPRPQPAPGSWITLPTNMRLTDTLIVNPHCNGDPIRQLALRYRRQGRSLERINRMMRLMGSDWRMRDGYFVNKYHDVG